MRVVDLPTSDPAEMAGMVELQVDKFSPFPVEHMAVAFELLSQKETSSRVLIATVQREIVENLGAAFREAGILPHWIDVEVMGWWTLLKEQGELPETGRTVLLILDGNGAELIICEDGIPVVIRSLGTAAGVSEDEFYAELADEIGYTLTTLEAEQRSAAGGSRIGSGIGGAADARRRWCCRERVPPPRLLLAGGARRSGGNASRGARSRNRSRDPPPAAAQRGAGAAGA